jgi:argininosuccinate lyase
MNATEAADFLVRAGVPFRDAHHAVGRLVLKATALGTSLQELTETDFRDAHMAFDASVRTSLGLEATLASKSASGGTAPALVAQALEAAKSRLSPASSQPR